MRQERADKAVCFPGGADHPGERDLHGVCPDQEALAVPDPALPLRGVGAHHADQEEAGEHHQDGHRVLLLPGLSGDGGGRPVRGLL